MTEPRFKLGSVVLSDRLSQVRIHKYSLCSHGGYTVVGETGENKANKQISTNSHRVI